MWGIVCERVWISGIFEHMACREFVCVNLCVRVCVREGHLSPSCRYRALSLVLLFKTSPRTSQHMFGSHKCLWVQSPDELLLGKTPNLDSLLW